MNPVPWTATMALLLLLAPASLAAPASTAVPNPVVLDIHPHPAIPASPRGWANFTGITGPSPRSGAGMAYDARDGYVLLTGGSSQVTGYLNDTWTFEGGVWTNLTPRLSLSPEPSGSDTLAYDALDGYVVLFDGSAGTTWTYADGAWTSVGGVSPSPRWYASLAYDGSAGQVVLFGGLQGSSTPLNDTWVFAGGTWQNLTASVGSAPPPRSGASLTYDPVLPGGGGLVLFGGYNGTSPMNDTWAFQGGHWKRLVTTRPSPSLAYPDLGWDSADQTLLLFGGSDGTADRNGTWLWNGTQWNSTPVGSSAPPAREGAAMAYDPWNGSTVLFGGSSGGTALGDTWGWFGNATFPYLSAAAKPTPSVLDLGESVNLSSANHGGFGTRNYTWSSLPAGCAPVDQPAFNCTPTSPGTSFVALLVNASFWGITNATPVPVLVNPALAFSSFSFSPTPVSEGSSVSVQASVSGGTAPYHYRYSGLPGGCASVDAPSWSCRPTTAGNFSPTVTVTDATGASVAHTTSLEVLGVAAPSVALTFAPQPAHIGVLLNLTANVTGGSAPLSYAWSLNGTSVPGIEPVLPFLPRGSGSYRFSVTITDSLGRNASANLTLRPTPQAATLTVSLSASSNSVPVGGSLVLTAVVNGGLSPYRYLWQLNGTNASTNTSSWSLQMSTPGTYTFVVFVTDASGAHNVSHPLSVTVTGSLTSAPSNLPLPASWIAPLALLAAVAVVLLLFGIYRRFKPPSKAPPPNPAAPAPAPSTSGSPGGTGGAP